MMCGVEAAIRVFERPDERPRAGVLPCHLRQQLRLDYNRLAGYCWKTPSKLDVDLLVVAGAAAYADRAVRRRRGTAWSRRLHLAVPVYEPSLWRSPVVLSKLYDALNFLTGDDWEFEFRQRKLLDKELRQLELLEKDFGRSAVLAYSGGLDSFAQVRLELLSQPNRVPLLITTELGGVSALVDATLKGHRVHQVGVPLSPRVGGHAEASFRSRMFVFLSSAAVAWHLSDAEEIILAEPGQGAIGPSIIPFADEHPYRGSHPGFSVRFSAFVEALWGAGPRISHPNLWKTKAQVLRELQVQDALSGWENTRSCSRNVGRQKGAGSPLHCGICGGCLLRRVSLASLDPAEGEDEAYYWQNLNASELAHSSTAPATGRTQTGRADTDVAITAALGLAYLARAGDFSSGHPDLVRAVLELSEALQMDADSVRRHIAALLSTHRMEWSRFLGSLSPNSWLVQLVQEA